VPFVAPLGDKNYADWAIRVKALCSMRGCAHALLLAVGSVIAAAVGEVPASCVTEAQSTMALSIIFLNVNERWLRQIASCEQAHVAWKLLLESHNANLRPMLTSLHDQLFNSQMKTSQSVDEYIESMECLQRDLVSFSQGLPLEQFMSLILRSLTPALKSASMHLLTNIYSLNMVTLRAALRAIESIQGPPQRALRVQGDGQASGQKGKERAPYGPCHHCGKPGHRKFDCHGWRAANPPVNAPGAAPPAPAPRPPGHAMTAKVGADAPSAGAILTQHCCITLAGTSADWIIDSGATTHMTGDSSLFAPDTMLPLKTVTPVIFGDGNQGWAEASGTVVLAGPCGPVSLRDVLYVPTLQGNLLSLPAATSRGNRVSFIGPHVTFQSHLGAKILTATLRGGLYVADLPAHCHTAARAALSSDARSEAQLWHERLGHTSYGVLAHMQRKGALPGCKVSPESFIQARDIPCEPCLAGRLTRSRHPLASTPIPRKLHRVHADLQGPFRIHSTSGAAYVLCIVDALTGYGEVALLRLKSDATPNARRLLLRMETQAGVPVQRFRTDGGTEFNELTGFFSEKGILREVTAKGNSVMNGVAERYNRSLLDRARSLLAAAGLPAHYWGEAVLHANALLNSVHRCTAEVSPAEAMLGITPDVSAFHSFGSDVWMHQSNPAPGKIGAKGIQGRYLGGEGPLNSGTYRVLVGSHVHKSCDVHFTDRMSPPPLGAYPDPTFEAPGVLIDGTRPAEESLDPLGEAAGLTHANDPSIIPQAPSGGSDQYDQVLDSHVCAPSGGVSCGELLLADSDEDEPVTATANRDPVVNIPYPGTSAPAPAHGHYLRSSARQPPALALVTASSNPTEVPATVLEALACPDSAHWQFAIDEELQAMAAHNCWTMESLPAGAHAIGSRFVFARKRDGRFKARLVAKGFSQRPGVDYDSTYAPVSSIATVRCFAATVALQDLEWTQIDFASAFLNGTLDRKIYMKPPPGCTFGAPGLVCALHRSIYGLKQAGYHWDGAIRTELLAVGFSPCDADPCLYALTLGCGGRVWLLLYVDDGLIAATSQALLEHWTAAIMQMFSARRLGEPSDFLGLQIMRDRAAGTLRVTQSAYINRLTEEYALTRAYRPRVPLAGPLPVSGEPATPAQTVSYPSIVGSLNYIACCTRPDISQAISALSRHLKAPLASHLEAALRVLGYLAGTSSLALTYSKSGPHVPVGYTDADFAGDPLQRRSTTGTVFLLASAAVVWASKLQTTVALSTTEAEYQAAGAASRDALWLRKITPDLGGDIGGPIGIFCDSESALALIKNPMTTQRSKHIDVVHHFARERALRGELTFTYIRTDENLADCLTKAVPDNKLAFCRTGLGLLPVNAGS